jgi:hypothetical protein
MEAKRPHQRLFIMADSCYSGNQILRLKQFEADLPASQRESLNVSFQSAGDANQTVLEDEGFTHGGLRKEGGRETQYWLEKQKGRVRWTERTRRPQDYHSSKLQKEKLLGFNIKTHAYKPGPNLKNKTAFDEGEEVYNSGDGDDQVKRARAHIHKVYCSEITGLPTDYEVRFENGDTKRVEQCELKGNTNAKWCQRNNGCSSPEERRAAAPSTDAEEFTDANMLPQNEEPLPDEATGDLDWKMRIGRCRRALA